MNYTIKETAERFKVKPLTIKRWIKKGYLKSFKIANNVYINNVEIERIEKGD